MSEKWRWSEHVAGRSMVWHRRVLEPYIEVSALDETAYVHCRERFNSVTSFHTRLPSNWVIV